MAGIWKQSDFPPPVGMSTSVSFFSRIDVIMSSCIGRKVLYPKYCCKTECGVCDMRVVEVEVITVTPQVYHFCYSIFLCVCVYSVNNCIFLLKIRG